MSTIQKQIRDKVYSLLVASTDLPSGSIYRSPRRDISAEDLPAVLMYSHGDRAADPEEDHSLPHFRIYTLRIEARAAERMEEDATDAMSISIRKAILSDDTLGGLASRTTWEQQQWDGVENQIPESGSALDFNFHYIWRPEW